MKTKIAAALSIVGVLGAGSAAALVNTQILDSGPTDSGASAAVLPPASSIELTVPTTPSTIATSVPDTSSTSVVETTTTLAEPVAPAASGYLTAFNVGDAGVVTVDVIDGRLRLVSAEPSNGWQVTKAEDDTNDDSDEIEDEVEVYFTSSSVRVEFEAHFVDGQIVPKVESKSIGGTTGATNTAPANTVPSNTTSNTVPSNTIDDDDDDHDDDHDDDRYDDDDHDDDHDDDRYDDDEDDDRDDD